MGPPDIGARGRPDGRPKQPESATGVHSVTRRRRSPAGRGAVLTREEALRTLILAALLSVTLSAAAIADAIVAGDWHANLGSGVVINMNVKPEGAWSSETLQNNKVIRQIQGTYKQTSSKNGTGTIVFVPTEVSSKSGRVETETDHYQMADNGNQMKLTSSGDTMVFHKRDRH
jgi:hypothetical protein